LLHSYTVVLKAYTLLAAEIVTMQCEKQIPRNYK